MALFVFACCALLWIPGCSERKQIPYSEIEAETDLPDQEGWNATCLFTNDGILEARLHYNHMIKQNKRRRIVFNEGIAVDFFDQGKRTSVLTADSGIVLQSTNSLLAIGNVFVISDSGNVSLTSERLKWNGRSNKIQSDVLVTIATDQDTVSGYDFESDRSLRSWKLSRATGTTAREIDLVKGEVRPSKRIKNPGEENKLDRDVEDFLKQDQER